MATRSANDTGEPREADPQVEATTPEVSPTKVSSRRAISDSDPLTEQEWMGTSTERPYAEAVSPQHREYLEALGLPVE